MKFTELEDSLVQRVVVYGAPKTGKSLLVGKLAEHYNLLWFDLERGSTVLKQLPVEWKDRINLIQLHDSRVYPIAIETCLKVIKGTPMTVCVAHGKVGCITCQKSKAPVDSIHLNALGHDTIVVFDSLTQLTNSAIANITKAQDDDYKLQQDDWGALKILVEKFLSQVQVAPFNIVCITHEEELYKDDKKKVFEKVVPLCGSSNSGRNSASKFDHVVYCDMKNKHHVAASGTDYSVTALTGSRTGVRMEDASKDRECTLLDIFTSWKLPNFGRKDSAISDVQILQDVSAPTAKQELVAAVREKQELDRIEAKLAPHAVVQVSVNTNMQVPLTPGQIALANMKARMGK